MTKALIRIELAQVNKYIDQRIKNGKKYSALEDLRINLLKELATK